MYKKKNQQLKLRQNQNYLYISGPFKPDPKCDERPKVTGPCRAAFKKWSFIVESKTQSIQQSSSKSNDLKCVEFTYGGCKGSNNRFDSKIGCEMACIGRGVGEPPPPPPAAFKPAPQCALFPGDAGPCKGAIPQWTYEEETNIQGTAASATRKCIEFTYGGCDGNKNKFDSKLECEMACIGQGVGKPPPGPKRYGSSDYSSYPNKDNNPDPKIDYNEDIEID